MFTPQTKYLENGMQISYDTLIEKKRELLGKQIKRKEELQADAINLFREFKNSLALPDDHTIDCEGRKIQYTSIFIKNASGLFELRPPPRFTAKFLICAPFLYWRDGQFK